MGLRTRWGTATSRITAATRRLRTYCPWSWRNAQQANDVWCTMDTDLMNLFGDRLSMTLIPQCRATLWPWKVPDLHGELVCLLDAPRLSFYDSMSCLAYKRCIAIGTARLSSWLSNTASDFSSLIIFSLECCCLSVTEIPSKKIGGWKVQPICTRASWFKAGQLTKKPRFRFQRFPHEWHTMDKR